ncbi:transposase [Corynebacterium cystitidis]|uniref:Transposase n=1 Tax=Corynebacterium cystitidis DSM 20524 TaxID=1121357 RepID=A0A1H9QM57_9CORY|nr:transposase [Corynebacterium cystitidis]WJY81740.1 hypothetical protein CCYS_03920 [Corynebacterium cystitidis DSM 20524]SER60929.1 Transposase [Corynebacterium cystitidis DSM 20524]SNV84163.1 transposase [Corynebacterium cystitidis]
MPYTTAAGNHGRRGRAHDPLYRHRKTLLTTEYYLTDRQREALDNFFEHDQDYASFQETWLYYQQVIDCYRDTDTSDASTKFFDIAEAEKYVGHNQVAGKRKATAQIFVGLDGERVYENPRKKPVADRRFIPRAG